MKITSRLNIDNFVGCKVMAIAGASRDPKSFSAQVADHLSQQGYELWLVNPQFEVTDLAARRVQNIRSLPTGLNHMLVLTPASQTEEVVRNAYDQGIRNVWIQQQSETPAALDFAYENNMNVVWNHCIFMFTRPTGIHRFHYRIKKFFRGIPV